MKTTIAIAFGLVLDCLEAAPPGRRETREHLAKTAAFKRPVITATWTSPADDSTIARIDVTFFRTHGEFFVSVSGNGMSPRPDEALETLAVQLAVVRVARTIETMLSGITIEDGVSRPTTLREAEEIALREAGWLPAVHEDARAGDWTPPEDRGNFWDFERAVNELRRRRSHSSA